MPQRKFAVVSRGFPGGSRGFRWIPRDSGDSDPIPSVPIRFRSVRSSPVQSSPVQLGLPKLAISVSQPVSHSDSQPISQPVSQVVSQSASQSVVISSDMRSSSWL